MKLFIVAIGLIIFFWLITMPRRKRRRDGAEDRRRRRAHNSRMVGYKGFPATVTPEGHRRIHATEKWGAKNCSDQCPYCAAGMEYQATQLRVFDDRPIRGRKDRRRLRDERGGSRRDRPWDED
jgi:hypothetical protein